MVVLIATARSGGSLGSCLVGAAIQHLGEEIGAGRCRSGGGGILNVRVGVVLRVHRRQRQVLDSLVAAGQRAGVGSGIGPGP